MMRMCALISLSCMQVAFGDIDGERVTVEFDEGSGSHASSQMLMDLMAANASDEVKAQLKQSQQSQQ